jgi:hypothetical protein
MKLIKVWGFVLVLMVLSTMTAQAAFIFGNDTVKFTGDAYIDTTSDPLEHLVSVVYQPSPKVLM